MGQVWRRADKNIMPWTRSMESVALVPCPCAPRLVFIDERGAPRRSGHRRGAAAARYSSPPCSSMNRVHARPRKRFRAAYPSLQDKRTDFPRSRPGSRLPVPERTSMYESWENFKNFTNFTNFSSASAVESCGVRRCWALPGSSPESEPPTARPVQGTVFRALRAPSASFIGLTPRSHSILDWAPMLNAAGGHTPCSRSGIVRWPSGVHRATVASCWGLHGTRTPWRETRYGASRDGGCLESTFSIRLYSVKMARKLSHDNASSRL